MQDADCAECVLLDYNNIASLNTIMSNPDLESMQLS